MTNTNQRTSAQVDRKLCIIPLQTDFDESKIKTIKHKKTETINNVVDTITVEVPKLAEDATPLQFLYFIRQFRVAAAMMNWTDARLFQKFRMHLEGDFQETWDAIANEYDQDNHIQAQDYWHNIPTRNHQHQRHICVCMDDSDRHMGLPFLQVNLEHTKKRNFVSLLLLVVRHCSHHEIIMKIVTSYPLVVMINGDSRLKLHNNYLAV